MTERIRATERKTLRTARDRGVHLWTACHQVMVSVFWVVMLASLDGDRPADAQALPSGQVLPVVQALPQVKIYLEEPGVYRVSQEELSAAGLGERNIPSPGLGLSRDGQEVPIWVEDGGDGHFGPGDWLEFVGERLAGEYSYFDEYSRYSVYFLSFDVQDALRMTPVEGPTTAKEGRFPGALGSRHFEKDLLILRLPPKPEPEEIWYWAKLAHSHREPFTQVLDLADLSTGSQQTARLAIELRGWSKPRFKAGELVSDHRVEVSLNGEELISGDWDGTRPYVIEIPELPVERLNRGENTLALRVPRRAEGKDGTNLIDVVMLNWIEISYPRNGWLGANQARLELMNSDSDGIVRLTSDPGETIRLYGTDGSRINPRNKELDGQTVADFQVPAGESLFVATRPGSLRSPERLVIDRPSGWADPANQADYIIITHQSLAEAIQPLADFHRSRGLETVVVDVEDVYDEFNAGVLHPEAIRSFLRFAAESWESPAPRFVLLVGDASWDGKNVHANDANYADWTYRPGESERFLKNTSTRYETASDLNDRNLIPTWNFTSQQGHSASDNYFVSVVGDDFVPDMAIGRFPVVEPEEVEQIVAKTIRYMKEPESGAWRRNMLFIANESQSFQLRSDRVAEVVEGRGYQPQKIYPTSSETSNEYHTERLIEAFDEGQLLVHFYGHGGRYIWRTGPPDLKKNHDLFTLEHLDELKPSGRLPVILAMTCYSAPFDHPNADSIGEKFLRVSDRGAVAVLAASWRISPSQAMATRLLEALTEPPTTVGEALMKAKHSIKNRLFVETFNLLGDPALALALPTEIDSLSDPDQTEVAQRPDIAHGGAEAQTGSRTP